MLAYIEQDGAPKFERPGVANKTAGRALLERYSDAAAVEAAFEGVRSLWGNLISGFQVECPDPHATRMLNTWNQYQCMATFNLSRSASLYEAGIGRGIGFRDSNQDVLGFVHLAPQRARGRLLDLAATQLSDGACFPPVPAPDQAGKRRIGSGFEDDHPGLSSQPARM